jgi:hypothetical protein
MAVCHRTLSSFFCIRRMRVSHAASFGVAVASILGRRPIHGLEICRRQSRCCPRVVNARTDQTGRSLLEGLQLR